jgi:hypothetical protein
MQRADTRLLETGKNILATEKRAKDLGVTTATSARSFEKLQEKLNLANRNLTATASAFQKGEASAKQMASALMAVDRAASAVNSRLRDTQARLADVSSKGSKGSNFLGNLDLGSVGNAALTGGVGGASAAILNEGIGLAKQFASALFDVSKSAVLSSAEFEKTVNAMTVFTGSTSAARVELAQLSDLAKNTPGLRLEDAQVGASRLRALGFSAEVASDLIAGLSKQKLFSGADEGAIDRVIVNLTQLRAGSPQITKDIQQIVLSLPSAINVINSAFGSIDKFKDAIKADPDTAINAFAEAMKNAQGVSGGLSDALGKLDDARIKAFRGLTEPALKPLTDGAKELTSVIESNQATWEQWGIGLGDTLRGVMVEYRAFRNLIGSPPPVPNDGSRSSIASAEYQNAKSERNNSLFNTFADWTTLGLSKYVRDVREQGREQRLSEPVGISMGLNYEQAYKEANEYAIKSAKMKFESTQEIERAGYKLSESLLQQHLSAKNSSEAESAQALGNIRSNDLRAQIQQAQDYYAQQIKNAADNTEKVDEYQNELKTIIATKNLEILANEAETQARVTEIQRKEQEKRKKLLQDFNKFRAQGAIELIKNPFEKIAAEGRFAASEAFDRFKDLGAGPANEAANVERLKAQKRLTEELKNQVDAVRNIAVSQSDNPYVRIFADARDAIEQARESTKYLSKEIQNAVIGGAQGANLRNLFNARVDTALDVSNLRQQADAIFFNRQISATDAMRNQYYAVQKADVDQATKSRRTAELFAGANPADVPNELRAIAYEALLKEASRREAFEKEGMKFYENFNKLIGTMGLKVDLGGQAITQIEVTSEKLGVKGVSLPSRSGSRWGGGTMGNGSFISGGITEKTFIK